MITPTQSSLPTGNTELMRRHPIRHVVIVMLLLWIAYSSSGFRNPLTPILHSDAYEGAGLRQALFTLAALSSLSLMFFTRTIGRVVTMNRSMLLLSLLVPISIIWSTSPLLTGKRSILFLFGLLTLYSVVYSAEKPVSKMLKVLTGSAAMVALMSLAIHFAFGQAYTVNPVRPGLAGITSHPNTLAPIMSIAFICSLGIQTKTFSGACCLRASQALIGLSLLMASSMTTLFATFIALGLFSLFNTNAYKRGAQQILLCAGLLTAAFIGTSTIKSTLFDVTGRDESLSGRDEVWSIVAVEGLKKPVFGRGFGAFWTEGKGRELVHSWNPRQSHNAYLDLWVDLGIVGVAALIFAYPWTLYNRWRAVKGAPGSAQRKAIAALYALSISYMLTYALAQSYFLRFDTFPFMSLTWAILLIGNIDQNSIEHEFNPIESAQQIANQ